LFSKIPVYFLQLSQNLNGLKLNVYFEVLTRTINFNCVMDYLIIFHSLNPQQFQLKLDAECKLKWS